MTAKLLQRDDVLGRFDADMEPAAQGRSNDPRKRHIPVAQRLIPKRWWRRLALALTVLFVFGFVWRVNTSVRRALTAATPVLETGTSVRGRTELRHAQRFTVEYRADSKVVRVGEPGVRSDSVYQLVPRRSRPSQLEAGAIVVEIPVRRVIALSTIYAPAFVKLGVPETLVGIAGAKLLHTPELAALVQQGQVLEVSDGRSSMQQHLDMERIRDLAPDLVLTSFFGDSGSKLREAGLPVVESSEWLEATPLARAEWIKLIAAFLDRELEGEVAFSAIEQRYASQAARARSVATRPTVLCGMEQRGTWYVPGGQSYLAALIRDAGGHYLWDADTHSASQPLKMEAVLSQARDAQVWLLHMSSVGSRQEMQELDSRYALFGAFRTGRLYNSDVRVNAAGGNDFWENGVANPDLLLSDLIAILHPELAPGQRLDWYRQLPALRAP